jgi:transposase
LQYFKKKETPIIDKEKFTRICIDDFAIRKRNKYGTLMIDIDTNRVVDMIDSRDLEEVKKWLDS